MIYLIIVSVLMFFGGLFNGLMDLSKGSFYYYKNSIFLHYDPACFYYTDAYRFKWKNGDKAQGEAFWQSSRMLVSLTDFWHFAKFSMKLCVFFSVAIAFRATWEWSFLYQYIHIVLCWGVGFLVGWRFSSQVSFLLKLVLVPYYWLWTWVTDRTNKSLKRIDGKS